MKALAVLLKDENTVKGLMFYYKGWWVGSFSQRLKHQSFFRFCRVDLGRADGDLLEKLIVLQHALKHKEEQRG